MANIEVENKRMRNRLAQRKYRDNLRKRIQDLEKRAATVTDPARTDASLTSAVAQSLNTSDPAQDTAGELPPITPTTSSTSGPSVLSNIARAPIASQSQQAALNGVVDVDDEYALHQRGLFQTSSSLTSFAPALQNDGFGEKSFARALLQEGSTLPYDPLTAMSGYALSAVNEFTLQSPEILSSKFSSGKLMEPQIPVSRYRSTETINSVSSITTDSRHDITSTMDSLDWQCDRSMSFSGPANASGTLHSALQESSEQRMSYLLRCIRTAGFDDIDAFFTSYYTDLFPTNTTMHRAQRRSRCETLPKLLEALQLNSKSWSHWEASTYKDCVIKSAEGLIVDEFDRLTKKVFTSEVEMLKSVTNQTDDQEETNQQALSTELHSLAAEIEATLKSELPNLGAFTMALVKHDDIAAQRARTRLLLATIKLLAHPGNELITGASDWTKVRALSRSLHSRRK